MNEWNGVVTLFVKYQISSYSRLHLARFSMQPHEYLETYLDGRRVFNLFGGTSFPMLCDIHCDVSDPQGWSESQEPHYIAASVDPLYRTRV
jgi:hypothetical protein